MVTPIEVGWQQSGRGVILPSPVGWTRSRQIGGLLAASCNIVPPNATLEVMGGHMKVPVGGRSEIGFVLVHLRSNSWCR